MSLPHNENQLGQPLRNKKKRGAVFIVIVVSIAVHVLGLGVLGVMKIVEVISPPPEFEAPPVEAIERPPPPPPPPPTTKRMQRSLPRPQPLAAQNPQNMSVPAISLQDSDLSIGGGRGFGGGLGELGGAVADSIRITSFGFDQAMEGTLKGTLYDLKRDPRGKALDVLGGGQGRVNYGMKIFNRFTHSFDQRQLERQFLKSETSLYGAYFVIPNTKASAAPRAFKAEGKMAPTLLAVVYSGTYRPTESGRFRLFGKGDDVLVVRVNGRTVLDGSWQRGYSNWSQSKALKRVDDLKPEAYFGLKQRGITGNWFDLREGRETDVEILISEVPGGLFGAYILIEKDGEPGKKIFTTRPLSENDKKFLKKSHPNAARFIK